ncbi:MULTISPECIES: hypothetical protein [unclassified Coleofasciculus]|uniref:hypothetical protein n=1 Tax=unclassified Coleofasciculus TaxID=2692782 RepID=UPI001880A507|nr:MULTISPECIES: hypothetical protein [unclassified Coleofasciculus]MBE9126845.1 hypothetical protein [Coleofasciculus sp. LEGE 07081]MBE9148945.1 hypothetical protein [Coleofasciculus sp. LEGE 07092]
MAKIFGSSDRNFFGGLGTSASAQTAELSEQAVNAYPPQIVQVFMNGCVGERGSEFEPLCACAIEQIQNEYTLEEFLVIALEMDAEKEMPEEFTPVLSKIFAACAAYYPVEGEQAIR